MTQLRLRYGISQADLANAAGVSRQLISLIELDTASQSKGHEFANGHPVYTDGMVDDAYRGEELRFGE